MSDKSVMVVGLGDSGIAAARLLASQGAHVIAVDNAADDALQAVALSLREMHVDVRLGVEKIGPVAVDLAVLSPGVPPENALVRELESGGVPVIAELELGYRCCQCPVVAITGTNGKTTTTELCARVLQAAGRRTTPAGNIGRAFCDVMASGEALDVAVLEVSSFQLERVVQFRPKVSVMLNVTPDHWDRYPSQAAYAAAKERIFLNQSPEDWAIVNADCRDEFQSLKRQGAPQLIAFSARGRRMGCLYWLEGTKIFSEGRGEVLDMTSTNLRGPHNAENIMAALAVGQVLGVSLEKACDAIKAYKPLPHRCEFVAEIDGVRYINDSKATNLDAVEKALAGFSEPVVLIAGGKDKGFDFAELNHALRGKVKTVVLIGDTRAKLAACWSKVTRCVDAGMSLKKAVELARHEAQRGDVVLLSPACSSYDMFENYEERGEQFKQIVRALASGK